MLYGKAIYAVDFDFDSNDRYWCVRSNLDTLLTRYRAFVCLPMPGKNLTSGNRRGIQSISTHRYGQQRLCWVWRGLRRPRYEQRRNDRSCKSYFGMSDRESWYNGNHRQIGPESSSYRLPLRLPKPTNSLDLEVRFNPFGLRVKGAMESPVKESSVSEKQRIEARCNTKCCSYTWSRKWCLITRRETENGFSC